jgi:hypothetical protein
MLRVRQVPDRGARRPFRAFALALVAGLSSMVAPRAALARSRDAVVRRLDKIAMNKDYFATHFDTAVHRLEHALALCGKSNCSPKARAQVERDLGVVYVVGLHQSAKGVASFKQAVADDPTIQLDPAFVTPEVTAAFAAAKGQGGSPEGGATGLQLSRVTEQRVKHPVPIYVSLGIGTDASEVRLYFKRDDQDHYRSVRMKHVGDGYGGLIPCDMVQHTGTIDFFVRALQQDQPVAHVGSDDQPKKVDIVEELDEGSPHWPGHDAPERCGGEEQTACQSDSDCSGGQHCNDAGHCVAKSAAPHGGSPVRLSLNVEQDAGFVGGSNVCTVSSQVNDGFACFRANGSQYHGNPIVGREDSIGSGLTFATTRVLVGGEYLLGTHFTIGLRLGYVLRGGGPKPDGGKGFLPVHAEARVGYFVRKDGFNASGFNPYFFLSGGLGQIDSKNQVAVFEDTTRPSTQANPPGQPLDAWRKMGTSFVGPGVGAYYALSEKTGLTAELRYLLLFPTSGSAMSFSLGFALGI